MGTGRGFGHTQLLMICYLSGFLETHSSLLRPITSKSSILWLEHRIVSMRKKTVYTQAIGDTPQFRIARYISQPHSPILLDIKPRVCYKNPEKVGAWAQIQKSTNRECSFSRKVWTVLQLMTGLVPIYFPVSQTRFSNQHGTERGQTNCPSPSRTEW